MIKRISFNTAEDECIDLAFFGDEPLLQFDLIRRVADPIENHPAYDKKRLELLLVTNGKVFSAEIADSIQRHYMVFDISCDGPPEI